MSSLDPLADGLRFPGPAAQPGAVSRNGVALIAQRDGVDGPLSTARLRRLMAIYCCLVLAGLALAFAAGPAAQAFGLGLLLPGGGFAAHLGAGFGSGAAAIAGMLLTLLLFAVGLFAWFGSGNILAPLLVWGGSALLAAALAPRAPWAGAPWLLAGVVAAGTVLGLRARARGLRRAIADRERRNAHLARATAPPAAAFASVAGSGAGIPDEACGYLRHVLDRALQPVEAFEGYDVIDQFQTASIRYQVCNAGYTLAVLQHEHLPAFRGYFTEAQRRLHAKMLDHRNWKYWALENAWGNLSLDPNPVPRDNIMYSGWYGAMLAEYIANTGDDRYNREPLLLRHPDGREWRYTFTELAEVIYRNFKRCEFTLFPCEPNWVYPLCNNFGAIALKVHDRVYGTHWWSDIEADYRRQFDSEFTTPDGRPLAIRSTRTGLTVAALTSVMADCVTAYFLHGILPDMARRAWEIARLDFIRVAEGQVELVLRGWDAIDTGNYRRSMVTTYANVGAAASEMGDTEVLRLLQQRVRDEYPVTGSFGGIDAASVRAPLNAGASNFAHASLLGLFAQGTGVRRSLHANGMPAEVLRGPMLAQAPYPDVLVLRAVNAGGVLDCTVAPGRTAAAGGSYTLGVEQLRPGASYRCEGLEDEVVRADASGAATVRVRLSGRQSLRLLPV